MHKVNIKEYAAVSPFGVGVDPMWNSLANGENAISEVTRFDVSSFDCKSAAFLDFDNPGDRKDDSLIWSLIEPIKEQIASWKCDSLILATTKGEIDLLEQHLKLNQDTVLPEELTIDSFLNKMLKYLDIPEGFLVSSACASSTIAISMGAEKILAEKAEKVAVIGLDLVSKFVFSGFSALQALSSANFARPFDNVRDGLIPGEACGAVLLTADDKGTSKGFLTGWGSSSDANHVTGPSRDGSGLAESISKALSISGNSPEDMGGISAHGTGTIYNDSMEMCAFRSLFSKALPLFSVKGALGHTMGASGIIETIISLKALEYGFIPPTAGFQNPDKLSEGWVSSTKQEIKNKKILKTNSGFGGINAALILEGRRGD